MLPFDAALLLSSLGEMFAINAEIEAMKAANQEREQKGLAQAYPEDSFKEKADQLWGTANAVRGMF